MNRNRIVSYVLFAILGAVLSIGGISWHMWQLWAICFICLALETNSELK